MHATITAIRTKSNALVESPTGTGKSLALLCASLAFQQHAIAAHYDSSIVLTQACQVRAQPLSAQESHPAPNIPATQPPIPAQSPARDGVSDDDDFAPQKKFRDVSWQLPKDRPRLQEEEQPANAYMLDAMFSFARERMLDSQQGVEQDSEQTQRAGKKVPRIFYATRTHKQVAHVIAELRKTDYRPRLCVLASRREYCLRDDVREIGGRDELCKAVVRAGECEYYYKAQELGGSLQLRDEVWDIEHLVELGRCMGGCAYYASHELYQNAQLVLCPYSFLVDPIVRGARGINVTGDVVILDEAHNIEGYARESVGFEAQVADMRRACEEVDTMTITGGLAGGALPTAYRRLKGLLECFVSLVDAVVAADGLKIHEHGENAVFERDELLGRLALSDITEEEVQSWRASYELIVNYGDGNEAKRIKRMSGEKLMHDKGLVVENDRENEAKNTSEGKSDTGASGLKPSSHGYGCESGPSTDGLHIGNASNEDNLSHKRPGRFGKKLRKRGRRRRAAEVSSAESTPWIAKCMTMTHSLLTTLEYFFANQNDFSLVIERKTVDYVTAISIRIICNNAAVCFRDISNKARSVIVTSGTLAPLESFAGELGTAFDICKSLPHIIDVRKQLFVRVVAQGPGREPFDATFAGSSKFSFQDALGQAICEYCKVIPGGVLVFFPSYRMMNGLHTRWRTTGLWNELHTAKGVIIVEPSQRGEDFDVMVQNYETACESEKGALLFGVCRGKLSEGVDFRDATARAVILVGIPFPHIGDVVVHRKRMWNDRVRKMDSTSKLQSGAEWYEIQAYRALNQALGRVVRHRFDYGAILLLDTRFRHRRVLRQLPRWTTCGIQGADGSHGSLLHGLRQFYSNVQENIAATGGKRHDAR